MKYPSPIYYTPDVKYWLRADFSMRIADDIPELAAIEFDSKFVQLSGGWLTVREGYAWDGPSGPTIDTPAGIYGSLTHDALYGLMRLGVVDRVLRKEVDHLFGRMLDDAGMVDVRKDYYEAGVLLFGGAHVKWDSEPPILTAP